MFEAKELWVVMIVTTGLACPTARAGAILDEDFPGTSLDPAWVVTTDNVTDYKYSVGSSKLTMSDSDPAATLTGAPSPVSSAISPSVNSVYGSVYFTRSLGAQVNDFDLIFKFSWDSTTTLGLFRAMPMLLIRLLDASNNVVVSAGLFDAWNNAYASRYASIGAFATTITPNQLPVASTGTTINITREGSDVAINWSGVGATLSPIIGTTSTTITKVQLQFARFRLDNQGNSTPVLGNASADLIQLIVPEPASCSLLAIGSLLMLCRRR